MIFFMSYKNLIQELYHHHVFLSLKKFKPLLYEIVLLSIAFIWVLFSYLFPLVTEEAMWFARSGAIMVLFSVAAEFKLTKKHKKKINSSMFLSGNGFPVTTRSTKEQTLVGNIAHIFIIIGTIIWGYGDLIHNLISKTL